MEICKTDLGRMIKYLEDAAGMYDRKGSLSARRRAWSIRQLIKKLKKRSAMTIENGKQNQSRR